MTPTIEQDTLCRPRASNIHIRLLKPADTTPGGIALPPSWLENFEEGEVVARGPGYEIPTDNGGFLTVMWATVGDRVFFREKDLRWVDRDKRIVCVRDEDLLAIVNDDDTLRPLNGYVILAPGPGVTESKSGIALPEGSRRRKDCGRIVATGPGALNLKPTSPNYGTRVDTCAIIGVEEPIGRVAYFDRDAEVLAVGRGAITSWFVQAKDLIAVEDA